MNRFIVVWPGRNPTQAPPQALYRWHRCASNRGLSGGNNFVSSGQPKTVLCHFSSLLYSLQVASMKTLVLLSFVVLSVNAA